MTQNEVASVKTAEISSSLALAASRAFELRRLIAAAARAVVRNQAIRLNIAPLSAARWRILRFGAVSHRAMTIGLAER
jgi:hypothetical protein